MGFEPPVLDQQHGVPEQDRERREFVRRQEDAEHRSMLPTVISVVVAICGGLAFLFLFFAAMGAIDIGDAVVATVIAVVLGLVWFAGFYVRHRNSESRLAERRDRERRGF